MIFDGEEAEEEGLWIPLPTNDEEPTAKVQNDDIPRVAYCAVNQGSGISKDSKHLHSNAKSNYEQKRKQQQHQQPKRSYHANDDGDGINPRLRSIQRKLEDRISIQNHLVNHPIDHFWQRCLINLLREIWNLEIRIRLGILLLAAGLLARVFLWSTWYLMYPRFAVLCFILVASLLYLDPFDLYDQIKGTWDLLSALTAPSYLSSQQQEQLMVKGMDTRKLRRLSFILFMIPTVLEVKTFSFLSQINAELTFTNVAKVNVNGWKMSSASFYIYDIGITSCMFAVMMFLLKMKGMKPCDVSYRGLLMLYGFSLLITIGSYSNEKNDLRRIPIIAAPFLTASATLLLMYQDDRMEWLSRILRQTFRLSLRDVLSSVSERVTEDKMLQLAILRWICDFWASNSASTTKPETMDESSNNSESEATGHSSSQPQLSSECCHFSSANDNPPSVESTEGLPFESNGIRWEELQPMLNIEIDHMETEIDALRLNNSQSSKSDDNPANNNRKQREHRNNSRDETDGMSPMPDSNTSKHQKQQTHHSIEPLMALKSMLLSLNVDERARPAVLAYKTAVKLFPPKKKTAVAMSIMRRCPALLAVTFHIFSVSDFTSLFISSLILSPFLVIEYYRIIGWMDACQRYAPIISDEINEGQTENDWIISGCLKNVNAMTILLSGDVHNAFRPPSLLLVWHNIVSSASALEVGLSTARCAETTAVAMEFAGSVMSLVKFGFEISHNGIFHGATVLLKEVMSIQGSGRDMTDPSFSDDGSTEYTSAAIRAVHSGQRVVRNIHVLSEDQHTLHIAQPVLHVFGMLTGYKWLWGKEEKKNNDFSQMPGTSPDITHGGLEVRDEKMYNFGEPVPSHCRSTVVDTNEGNNMDTTNMTSTRAEAMPEAFDNLISTQNELVQTSPTAQEELSQVMEMVALSYENGLIEETEKDDFFQKLVEFREEELFDPSILSAMKRTLCIVLENGVTIPTRDCTFSGVDSMHLDVHNNRKCENRSDSAVSRPKEMETENSEFPHTDRIDSSQTEEIYPLNARDGVSQTEQSSKYHDNLITVGVAAALGAVVSGVVLTMGINAQKSDDEQNSFDTAENVNTTNGGVKERNQSSTVEIVELTDDSTEENWVAID